VRILARFGATLFVLAVLFATHPALAGSQRVSWASIEVRPGDDAARLHKELKAALTKATKKASFGKAKGIVLTATLVEFTSAVEGDVVHVTCAMKGRVIGHAAARSRLVFGGSPKDRAKLEKQVIEMVSRGLVARLAAIARDAD